MPCAARCLSPTLSLALMLLSLRPATTVALEEREARVLAERARAESGVPVRPFVPGAQPAWNGRAVQFLHAPAFGLPSVKGAVRYRFSVKDSDGREASSFADEPWAALTPVWADLKPGPVTLTVEGLDAAGVPLPGPAVRSFHRAPTFSPSASVPPDFGASAEKALVALADSPDLACWFKGSEPDPAFPMYRYPAKIVGAAAAALARRAAGLPDGAGREACVGAARRAADHMLSLVPVGKAAWAHHPPTYHPTLYADKLKGHMASGRYMTNCGAEAGRSLLEVHAVTREARYLEAAVRIAETYRRNQLHSGSWWLFVDPATGAPAATNVLIPTSVLAFLDELEAVTADGAFRDVTARALAWTMENPVRTWDWQGQFEDVRPAPPYENLTKHEACDLAIHLFGLKDTSEARRRLAQDLLRFAEDQFVVWEGRPSADPVRQGADGAGARSRRWLTPCVLEQYRCYAPVSASSAKLIRAFLAAWSATGDRMHLEKARALGVTLTQVQSHPRAPGRYQTWVMNPPGAMWFNCELAAVRAMQELAAAR